MTELERLAEKKRVAYKEYESIMSGSTIASFVEKISASDSLNSAVMAWHNELMLDGEEQ